MSKSSQNGELVLASGVAYFSENFNALPHVINALTTRASTMETLKADAASVDRTLAKLLDRGSDALLTSTSLLSSVSSEFEESRARVRDLKRRVGASLASLSGRRRDLNGLTFRQQQIEHGLRMLETVEICLRACQGPLSIPVREDAENLKRALHLFQTELVGKASEPILAQVKARLDERQSAICKLLRAQLLDSVSARGPCDDDISATLAHLLDLGALDETLADAARVDLRKPCPLRLSRFPNQVSLPTVRCDFLTFPSMDSIENAFYYVKEMIAWGELLMERSNQLVAGVRVIGKSTSHVEDTWTFIQTKMEQELTPLLDAFASAASSTQAANNKATGDGSSSFPRPKHYTRNRNRGIQTSDSSNREGPQGEKAEDKFEPSPYHLAFITAPLLAFLRRFDPSENGRLVRFLRRTCETSLRSVINRDVASIFQLNPSSRSPDYARAALRLQKVVEELNTRVLDRIEICDAKQMLLDVCLPFVYACKVKIDNAVDSAVSAWIARGGSKLVQALRTDPLFLTLEASRNGSEIPVRHLLLEAAFEHAKQSSAIFEKQNEEGEVKVPKSDISILVALSACLHKIAGLVPGQKGDKSEILSTADYALFATRADIYLRIEASLRKFSAGKMEFRECTESIIQAVRETRSLAEDWVEFPAVFDYVFLPAAMHVCRFLSRVLIRNKDLLKNISHDQLFALHSAFGAALVDASEDPWTDLAAFTVLHLALRVTQTWPDNTLLQQPFISDAEAKELHRQQIAENPFCLFLFAQEEVVNL